MKLIASLLVVFTFFYCTCAHVSYSDWRLIDTVCQRPNSGECSKAGTCCGRKLSGTQRLERDCEHDTCPPDMLTKTQGCAIRCGDADASAYGAWVRAGNCERPTSGRCAAEDTCCGEIEGTMKHTRACNAANGCDAPTLERHFKCNLRCGFVNPCRLYPNPCENGGTCVEDGHSHSCTCASGWTGHHCDEDTDECASNPCQNGGTCTDGVNTYSCACANGYSGGDCSINNDECASNPCQNGGVCTDGDNTYSCACADGFIGGDCSQAITCGTAPTTTRGSNDCTATTAYAGTCTATCESGFYSATTTYTCGDSNNDGIGDFNEIICRAEFFLPDVEDYDRYKGGLDYAENYCRTNFGSLVTFEDEAKYNKVYAVANEWAKAKGDYQPFWTGMRYPTNNNVILMPDLTTPGFANWYTGYPQAVGDYILVGVHPDPAHERNGIANYGKNIPIIPLCQRP